MRIFRYDSDTAREIKEYNSSNVYISPILQIKKGAVLYVMSFDPHGIIGFHQAGGPQVLFVIQGKGWVRGESPEPVPVSVGNAVFWEPAKWHESGSEAGMTSIVIEGTAPNNLTLSKSQ